MRKVYLITAILLACGFIGLGLWYRHIGAPTNLLADVLPGVERRAQPTVTFAVIGDNEGDNPTYRNLIQQVAKNPDVQFILHVGDVVANGGATELTAIQNLHAELGVGVPVYAVPGNHDTIDDPNRAAFARAFGATPRSVDVENIHLILLDNAERKVGFTDETLAWLETDLKDWDKRKPTDGVTLIAYHRPFAYPLADILGDDETRTSRASNERFLGVLAQHEVAHIFTGHVHTAITYAMVAARDNANKPIRTIPVTVSGGGGQPIQTAFGALLQTEFHALVVTVTEGEVTTTTLRPRS